MPTRNLKAEYSIKKGVVKVARFYGIIKGRSKTAVTRLGSERSGLTAHVRGWNVGVFIRCEVDEDGKDTLRIYRTKGSNNPTLQELIAEIKED